MREKYTPPSPTWGGAPLAPGEEPYPQDHPNYHMMTAPPAPPPEKGPLGGLLSTADITPPSLRRLPWAMSASEGVVGITWVRGILSGWTLTAGDITLLKTSLPLLLGVVLVLTIWAGSRLPRRPVDTFLLGGVYLLLIMEWVLPTSWLPFLTWGQALLGAVWVGRPGVWGQHLVLSQAPLHLPHRVARVVCAGASLSLPLAIGGGSGEPSVRLLSQLFSFSLICHAFFAQRTLLKPGLEPVTQRAGTFLRVGELSHAWRWVLWLGCLIPLLLTALALRLPWLSQPGWYLAGGFAAIGLPLFHLLWIRASIRAEAGER